MSSLVKKKRKEREKRKEKKKKGWERKNDRRDCDVIEEKER